MNPRVEYEMSEEDLKQLLDACKPTPVMFLSGGQPMGASSQENANRAWAELGKHMGFDSMSVRPSDKGQRFFTAVPAETSEQRIGREKRELEAKRQEEIRILRETIEKSQQRLDELSERGGL